MLSLTHIVHNTRQTGNTTWILKSAIKNPKCVIVAINESYAKDLEKKYYKLLSNVWWGQKLWWKWFGRQHPKFMSMRNRFEGIRLPIIFDNSCMV